MLTVRSGRIEPMWSRALTPKFVDSNAAKMMEGIASPPEHWKARLARHQVVAGHAHSAQWAERGALLRM
eukprot:8423872-Pyramimonas_sp.AAC.1